MAINHPRRIVLRFNYKHEQDCHTFAKIFFDRYPNQATDDYFERHVPQQEESSKIHIVLDMHCKQFPNPDVQVMPYIVFQVSKRKGSDE